MIGAVIRNVDNFVFMWYVEVRISEDLVIYYWRPK